MGIAVLIVVAVIVVIGIVLIGLIGWAVGIYNALIRLRNEVQNAWSQIDVQLKRRFDLIPNLMETVKGYAAHEKETFTAVTEARAKVGQLNIDAKNMNPAMMQQFSAAQGELGTALSKLMVVMEKYPDLKANQNFLALQEELTSTENKISAARRFYNDSCLQYNNKREMFPGNVVANFAHFQKGEFFEVKDEAEREAPKVNFSS